MEICTIYISAFILVLCLVSGRHLSLIPCVFRFIWLKLYFNTNRKQIEKMAEKNAVINTKLVPKKKKSTLNCSQAMIRYYEISTDPPGQLVWNNDSESTERLCLSIFVNSSFMFRVFLVTSATDKVFSNKQLIWNLLFGFISFLHHVFFFSS